MYCKRCGKDSKKAKERHEKALLINKIHAGDFDKPFEITCIECGKTILTTQKRGFCSIVCQESHRIQTAKCPVCRALLIDKGNETGRGYCSDDCKQASRLKRAIESGDYVPCEFCGKEFIRKNYSNVFCSNDCYLASRAEKRKAKEEMEKSRKPRLRQEERKCEACGKPFLWKITSAGQRFCSPECRNSVNKKVKKKDIKKLKLGKELHICTVCKTSQKDCERFTSNFMYSPKGAIGKTLNGKFVIVSCPKFTD